MTSYMITNDCSIGKLNLQLIKLVFCSRENQFVIWLEDWMW